MLAKEYILKGDRMWCVFMWLTRLSYQGSDAYCDENATIVAAHLLGCVLVDGPRPLFMMKSNVLLYFGRRCYEARYVQLFNVHAHNPPRFRPASMTE
jgi:hypothetical protein